MFFRKGSSVLIPGFDSSFLPVRNMPKFKDRANWSRDTIQPMRRRAFVYSNIDQVLKNFSQWRTGHCYFVLLLTGFTLFQRKHLM